MYEKAAFPGTRICIIYDYLPPYHYNGISCTGMTPVKSPHRGHRKCFHLMTSSWIYIFCHFRFLTADDYLWYLDKYYTGLSNFRAAKNFEPAIEQDYLDVLAQREHLNVSYHVANMRAQIRSSSLQCEHYANGSWLISTWWFDNMTVMVDAMYIAQTSLADTLRDRLSE